MAATTCPSCDAEISSTARFCPECGHDLEGDAARSTTGLSDGRTLAALTHILALLTWVLGPLIILFVSDDPFVLQNARNALMWQVMVLVYGIISAILVFLVVGIFLLLILGIIDLVFCIIAAVKASEGEAWQYPLTPRV